MAERIEAADGIPRRPLIRSDFWLRINHGARGAHGEELLF